MRAFPMVLGDYMPSTETTISEVGWMGKIMLIFENA